MKHPNTVVSAQAEGLGGGRHVGRSNHPQKRLLLSLPDSEKYLKALLQELGVGVPRTHNLNILLNSFMMRLSSPCGRKSKKPHALMLSIIDILA